VRGRARRRKAQETANDVTNSVSSFVGGWVMLLLLMAALGGKRPLPSRYLGTQREEL